MLIHILFFQETSDLQQLLWALQPWQVSNKVRDHMSHGSSGVCYLDREGGRRETG